MQSHNIRRQLQCNASCWRGCWQCLMEFSSLDSSKKERKMKTQMLAVKVEPTAVWLACWFPVCLLSKTTDLSTVVSFFQPSMFYIIYEYELYSFFSFVGLRNYSWFWIDCSIQFYLLYTAPNNNITTLCVSVWDLGWCYPGRYHSHQSRCNSQVHISLNLSSIPTPSCLVHEWMFLLLIRMNFRERGGMLHLWKFTMDL